jgi:hypothetical protein
LYCLACPFAFPLSPFIRFFLPSSSPHPLLQNSARSFCEIIWNTQRMGEWNWVRWFGDASTNCNGPEGRMEWIEDDLGGKWNDDESKKLWQSVRMELKATANALVSREIYLCTYVYADMHIHMKG